MQAIHLKGKKILYDGTQLRSLWAFENWDIQGDSIVSFRGPCRVSGDNLVDMVDRKHGDEIISRDMVHFIVELFRGDLDLAIALQRLLVCIIEETLRERSRIDARIVREGDDIYVLDGKRRRRKLTVSIATASPVSCLIHTGVNVNATGAPVPAAGLKDLGVPAGSFPEVILARFVEELASMRSARSKVRPVP